MSLKQRLMKYELARGLFIKCPCPELVEMVGYSGMDFVAMDQEHSNLNAGETEQLIRAAEYTGMTPMVRLASPEEAHIIHALDSGARGLIIPGITNEVQAAEVTRLTKFFPAGMRGMNGGSRAANHGYMDRAASMDRDNRENFTMIMVESCDMVSRIDRLVTIDTLDGIFIGPADLSQSMGIPGQVTHPELIANVEKVCAAARKAGKFIGMFAGAPASAELYIRAGVNLIVYGTEMGLLKKGLKAAHDELDGVFQKTRVN